MLCNFNSGTDGLSNIIDETMLLFYSDTLVLNMNSIISCQLIHIVITLIPNHP